MKSEKEKLAAKSVTALKASAKRLGGKLVNPDGKAKTKQQLINTIVMKNRLAGKSMGGNVINTANQKKDNNDRQKNLAELKKLAVIIKALDKEIAKAKKSLGL
jgi:hypothetical protein